MDKKTENIILIISMILVIIITFVIGMVIIDFYKDYQCSTSQDINWFMENNCMRYVEREIRNK